MLYITALFIIPLLKKVCDTIFSLGVISETFVIIILQNFN